VEAADEVAAASLAQSLATRRPAGLLPRPHPRRVVTGRGRSREDRRPSSLPVPMATVPHGLSLLMMAHGPNAHS
jgi:hypothetical protein